MAFTRNKNLSLALNLAAMAIGMCMLAYASVPFYRLFCRVTGYGGTTQEAKHAPAKALAREITVTFNADIDPNLPWDFTPDQKSVKVKVGKQTLIHYTAHNQASSPITGRAVYNVTPFSAGAYFVKVECFCFKEQTLTPNQTVNMPVSFYIDPSIMDDKEMDDVKTITLSYTFFPVKTATSKIN